MYADAIRDPNHLYTDPDAARNSGLPDVMAPPTLLTDTFRFYGDAINERGLPSTIERQSLGTPIRAGNRYRFYHPVPPPQMSSPQPARSSVSGRSMDDPAPSPFRRSKSPTATSAKNSSPSTPRSCSIATPKKWAAHNECRDPPSQHRNNRASSPSPGERNLPPRHDGLRRRHLRLRPHPLRRSLRSKSGPPRPRRRRPDAWCLPGSTRPGLGRLRCIPPNPQLPEPRDGFPRRCSHLRAALSPPYVTRTGPTW